MEKITTITNYILTPKKKKPQKQGGKGDVDGGLNDSARARHENLVPPPHVCVCVDDMLQQLTLPCFSSLTELSCFSFPVLPTYYGWLVGCVNSGSWPLLKRKCVCECETEPCFNPPPPPLPPLKIYAYLSLYLYHYTSYIIASLISHYCFRIVASVVYVPQISQGGRGVWGCQFVISSRQGCRTHHYPTISDSQTSIALLHCTTDPDFPAHA